MKASAWRRVAFSDALSDQTAQGNKVQQTDFQDTGKIPIVDQGQRYIAGYSDDTSLAWKGELPVIVFGDHTRAFKYVDFPFILGADGVKVLVPCKDLNAKFAFYYLRSADIPSGGYSRHFRYLKEQSVPLPPLSEQKRIVKILDEAEELRRLRERADRRTADLIPAIFHEMFGDPATNPKGWEQCFLSQVGKLDRGRSRHRPRDEPSLYGGPYPFIQTGDVANSDGLITQYSQTYSDLGLAQSRMWPAGTLCITIAANIAKTAILTFPACFPDSIVGFFAGDLLLTDYVRQWFVTMEAHLDEVAPQAAQKNINLKILGELRIPVPPLALQREFAARVAEVRALETKQAESRRRLDDLFASLLHRAFRGEL